MGGWGLLHHFSGRYFALSALLALGGVPARALAEAAEGAPVGVADAAGRELEAGGEEGVAGGLDSEGLDPEVGHGAPVADAETAAEEEAPGPDPVEEGAAETAAEQGGDADPVAEEAPDPAAEAPGGQAALAAQGDYVASGTWGGCDWSVDAGGTLRVAPTDGVSGQLADSRWWDEDGSWHFPWYEHSARVRAVVLADGVALPGDCTGMFLGCSSLASLDASGWDTSGVWDMSSMFSGCSKLSSLDASGWDTSGAADMTSMFDGCSSLASLDLSGWATSGVTSMSWMFSGCSSLKTLDLSGWDTSGVTKMSSMFWDCSSLASLDLSGWDTSQVTDMSCMFADCSSLASLDLSGWDTSKVESMDGMFRGCSSLESLDVSGWDTTKAADMSAMFLGCSSLASLDLSGWDTSRVTDMRWMFEGCTSLASLDLSGWKLGSVAPSFSGLSKLASLDASGWDTSGAADMAYMFSGCASLSSLDLSGWDTSAVKNMTGMFYCCSSLSSLDLSGWDTSQVTDMSCMFADCPSLRALRVGKGYAIGGADMFPESNASNGRWWSFSEGAWLARDEIVSKRSGVADTYRTAGGAERANPISASARRPSVPVAYGPTAARATPANVAVSGAVGALSYANASAGAGARRFRVDAGTGRVTVPKATPAGAYAVRVRVTAAGGPDCLPGSRTVSYEVVVRPAKASRPRTVARTSGGEVAVSWEAAKGAKTYQLQWRRAGAGRWTTVSVRGRKKTLTGLERGALYEFRVRGVSGEARGKWSKASLRWLRGVSKAKAAPGRARGSVRATWGADRAATGGFRVFVYAKRGGKLVKTEAVRAGSTSATVRGLRSGRAYYVRVRPYRAEGGATYCGALSGWRAARAR